MKRKDFEKKLDSITEKIENEIWNVIEKYGNENELCRTSATECSLEKKKLCYIDLHGYSYCVDKVIVKNTPYWKRVDVESENKEFLVASPYELCTILDAVYDFFGFE